MVNMAQSGNWVHKWGLNLVVITLLGIITFGGREAIVLAKDMIKEQKEINIKQQDFNIEILKQTIRNEDNVDDAFNLINSVDGTNEDQGKKIMDFSDRIVKVEKDIEHLKEH